MKEAKLKRLQELKEKLTNELAQLDNKINDLEDEVEFEIEKNDEDKYDMVFSKGDDEFHIEDVTYEGLVDISNKIFRCVMGDKFTGKVFNTAEDFIKHFEQKFNRFFV